MTKLCINKQYKRQKTFVLSLPLTPSHFLSLLFLLALHLSPFTLFGQGTVRGTVFDDANGEAVPFANVVLDGTKYGCATDLSGFFLINKIPYGTY